MADDTTRGGQPQRPYSRPKPLTFDEVLEILRREDPEFWGAVDEEAERFNEEGRQ